MNIGKALGKQWKCSSKVLQIVLHARNSNILYAIKIPRFFNTLEAHEMLLISLYCIKTWNFGIYIRFHTVDMEGGRQGDNLCVPECHSFSYWIVFFQ